MEETLMFWTAGQHLQLLPAEVARELTWGEEVEGLLDLPIKDILDQLKAAFPDHVEQPGVLTCQGETGSFEATWTWQHLQLHCRGLGQADRQRLIGLVTAFGCTLHESQ